MSRYHFNVHDGQKILDPEGTELPDLAAAQKGAVKLAGQLLTEYATALWAGEEWMLEVTDDTGLVLFSITVMATLSPILSAPVSGR